MEAKLGKAEKKAFRIANLLDDAADALRKRSKRAYREGRMSLEEYMEARAKELELRAEVSVVVASDLGGVLEEATGAAEHLERAILDAKVQIERVRSVENGLKIVEGLVSLASALASGDFKRFLKAWKHTGELN